MGDMAGRPHAGAPNPPRPPLEIFVIRHRVPCIPRSSVRPCPRSFEPRTILLAAQDWDWLTPVCSRRRPRFRSAGAAETWYVDMERPCKLEVRGRVTLSFCSLLCSREVNGTGAEVGFIDG